MKRGIKPTPAPDRFWRLVDKRGPEECWPWLGCRHRCGHGQFNTGNRVRVYAHRFSFELHHGRPVAEGMGVLHKPRTCHNPACVNPAHLYEGTDGQNSRDKILDETVPIGEEHWKAKLSESDIPKIWDAYHRDGVSSEALAEDHGVSRQCISGIVHGRVWRHVTRGMKAVRRRPRSVVTPQLRMDVLANFLLCRTTQVELCERFSLAPATVNRIVHQRAQ